MEEPFSYSDRWDSVGLSCGCCIHSKNVDWPNRNKDYGCELHSISLAKILNRGGHVEGEWFCNSFQSNGKANPKAVKELSTIVKQLNDDVLYGAYGDPYANNKELKEIPFVKL